MKKSTFDNDLKKDIRNISVSFAILLLITFSLIFLLKISSNVIVNVFLHLLLLSDIIAICLFVVFVIYIILDYKYQQKYYAIVKSHLSDTYTRVFPKLENLSSLSILRQPAIICKAKLNSDGNVVLKIENTRLSSESCNETSISNFELFCQIFKFEE